MMARQVCPPRLVALLVAALVVTLSVGTMAAGADDLPAPSLEVNSVDARGATLGIDVTNTGPADGRKLSVAVDGKPVDVPPIPLYFNDAMSPGLVGQFDRRVPQRRAGTVSKHAATP